ncbi:MAG: polysaccharide biosynthesis/export family protein [Planctomycetota bacterium]|nr:polysaccharide biosynthesis/export family protein [Planctomycetota bacterium]
MPLRLRSKVIFSGLLLFGGVFFVGCNANSWMADPAATGYYKPTPTTNPILDRIDIIEESSRWPQLSKVTPADLMPSDLTYKIAPSDFLDVSIYGLYAPGQQYPVQRRVDQGGYFRVPEVGDVLVAGLTPQEAQDVITVALRENDAMANPSVQVDVLDQTGFTYTVYGGLARWGVFNLRDPNLLLVEALAQTGGVPQTTKNIYVIRQLPVSDSVLPVWNRDVDMPKNKGSESNISTMPITSSDSIRSTNNSEAMPNIEDLINQLDIGRTPSSPEIEEIQIEPDPISEVNQDLIEDSAPPVLPAILQVSEQELIDIDDLIPAQVPKSVPVDVDDILKGDPQDIESSSAYIYVPENDSWIPVSTDMSSQKPRRQRQFEDEKASQTMLERIIVIPWKRLRRGDSSYNIVVRPEDRIYVEPPPIGQLYIRGEVSRPGVYDYPVTGDRITLSQFITAAGDLGPIAEPDKVSITRRIGENLEATVTLNFAAILQHTEPDIFLKPSDHISVGTSWGATPMAIIRNGFRSTYGFGFLLDRNFGNDVFGTPP